MQAQRPQPPRLPVSYTVYYFNPPPYPAHLHMLALGGDGATLESLIPFRNHAPVWFVFAAGRYIVEAKGSVQGCESDAIDHYRVDVHLDSLTFNGGPISVETILLN